MTIKEIIDTMKMENDLILFDPMTGVYQSIEEISDLNRKCYFAHDQAIEILEKVGDLAEGVIVK